MIRALSPLLPVLLAGLILALVSILDAAIAEIVSGNSNPDLAGIPPGSTDSGFDSVPAQSTASATGGVHFDE